MSKSKIKTEWDLKKHYYKSDKDKQIEKDVAETEEGYAKFHAIYSNNKWTGSVKGTTKAINDYLQLGLLPGETALYYYFYRRELNAGDEMAERMINLLESRLIKAGNQILFFEVSLARLPKKMKKQLLASKDLEHCRYFLISVFDTEKHILSEPEEKILSLRSLTSRSMWISATEKILNKKIVKWKGEDMPINSALMQVENLPKKERHQMWKKIVPVLEAVGEVAENELVALAHDKKISDELRGYSKPYSATTKSYDSEDMTLEKLVSVIETRGYKLSKSYYALKSKLLGGKLDYIDRNEPLGRKSAYTFDEAVRIVREVFYDFEKEYGRIFDEMLQNGQIDVFPKKGRGSGAFCSSGVNQPTFVFLNHNNSVDAVRTLAHEMGHAIHAYRSKTQPHYYQGHSTLTAETASTFFESLVAEKLIENARTKQEKISLLDSFINQKISTMIMCIARFKYELQMHNEIREQGALTFQQMAKGLANEFKKQCGTAVIIEPEHGLSIVWKTHYRRNFYQYSYSFGEIGSSIMRNRYKTNAEYAKEVDTFLTAGDSDTVENIFKNIGIDMSKESTYHEALDLLEADIKTLKKLVVTK